MAATTTMLQRLFAEKFTDDNREAFFSFDAYNHKISFVMLDPRFIFQVVTILTMQMLASTIMAVITYHYIIRSQQTQRYHIGFGMVIPSILYLPFPLMELLDIRSRCTRLGLISGPLTVSLKCLEAMFGFAPEYATRSLYAYIQYMGYIQYPKMDPKTLTPVPATVSSVWKGVRTYLIHALLNGLLYTILAPYDYAPFPTTRPDTEIFVTLDLNQLLNNFILAILISLSLVFSMNGVGSLVELLGGFQTQDVVNNPLFRSTSVSDFWGVRWNKLIHRGLKQGIYKPIISSTKSRPAAAMATFLASGLGHEYVWKVMFYINSHEQDDDPYVPPFGKSMLFFGWNGVLILTEYWIGKQARWDAMFRSVPQLVISLLVVMTGLPVAHLFIGDFRKGGYFRGIVSAWPMAKIEKL